VCQLLAGCASCVHAARQPGEPAIANSCCCRAATTPPPLPGAELHIPRRWALSLRHQRGFRCVLDLENSAECPPPKHPLIALLSRSLSPVCVSDSCFACTQTPQLRLFDCAFLRGPSGLLETVSQLSRPWSGLPLTQIRASLPFARLSQPFWALRDGAGRLRRKRMI
jgi:hypothetical protein